MTQLEARSRWSYASRCPRMAALALLGAEPAEPDEITRRLWERGKDCERYYGRKLAAKYGEDGVLRQKTVPWPGGIGHPDFFITAEALTTEVKSRTNLEPSDADFLQLAGYMHFDQESRRGALVLLNPSDYDERILPVKLTAELRELVQERTDMVVSAGKGGALPDCVCSTPAECRFGNFCPFTEQAWADWTPPEPIKLDDPRLAELAVELQRAHEHTAAQRILADAAKLTEQEIKDRLLELGIAPNRAYEVNGIAFKATEVAARTTFDMRSAIKAGAFTEDSLAAWRKVGDPHYRWKVEKVGEATQTPDYGPAPF